GRRLREVGPGIEHELLGSDAVGLGELHAIAQEGEDIGDDVVVMGEVLVLGFGAGVHHHEGGTGGGAGVGQLDVAQPADVVDDVGAGVDGGARHGRLPRVDGDGDAGGDEPLD